MAWEWKATGDSRHAQRAVEQLDRRLARLEERNAQLASRSRQTNRTMVSGNRQSSTSFGSVAKSVAGVTAAIGLAVKAAKELGATIEENKRKAAEAKDANLSLASAQETAAKNLTGVDTDRKRDLLTTVPTQIQSQTGFRSRAHLISAIGAGYSASGDIEATVESVRAAARLNRHNPEKLMVDAAAALDIGRASGIKNAERNLGAMLATGSVSRVSDPRNLAESLGKIAESVAAAGEGPAPSEVRAGFAVFAALNKSATDVTGDTSSTASISLINKLDEFFSGREDAPGTNRGRIRALAMDESLREQFLGSTSFEIRYKSAIRELLTANTKVNEMYLSNLDTIQFDAGVYRANADELQGLTPQMMLASIQSSLDAAKSTFQIGQNREAIQSMVQQTVQEGLRLTRSTTWDRFGDSVNGTLIDVGHQLMQDIGTDFGFDSSSYGKNKRLIGQLGSRLDTVAMFGRDPEDIEQLPEGRRAEAQMLQQMIELLQMANEQLSTLNDGVNSDRARARDRAAKRKAVTKPDNAGGAFIDSPF